MDFIFKECVPWSQGQSKQKIPHPQPPPHLCPQDLTMWKHPLRDPGQPARHPPLPTSTSPTWKDPPRRLTSMKNKNNKNKEALRKTISFCFHAWYVIFKWWLSSLSKWEESIKQHECQETYHKITKQPIHFIICSFWLMVSRNLLAAALETQKGSRSS